MGTLKISKNLWIEIFLGVVKDFFFILLKFFNSYVISINEVYSEYPNVSPFKER